MSPRLIAFGDRVPFVAAIVAIDLNTVGNWAERRNLAYTSFQDLSAKPEVRQLVAAEIAKCNAGLPPASGRSAASCSSIRNSTPDDNEITRTRKIRRRFVAERYAPVVEAFYSGAAEVELATEITYEDGRRATLNARSRSTMSSEAVERTREPAYA